MSARGLILGVVPSLCVLALCGAVGAAPAFAGEGCENEARRVEQASTFLPECRAYELANPLGPAPYLGANSIRPSNVHQGSSISGEMEGTFGASVDGNRFLFDSFGGAPTGATSAGPYWLVTRGSAGWTTQDLIPPNSTNGGLLGNPFIAGASPDLSKTVLADGWGQLDKYTDESSAEYGGHDEPLLVPGEPVGAQNLFVRDSETGTYSLVNVTPFGLGPRDAWFQAGSSDLSHVVFTSPLALTPEAPTPPEFGPGYHSPGEDLFESFNGVIHLVTILPNGNPTLGLLAGAGMGNAQSGATYSHPVSADGERVYFVAEGTLEPRNAYLDGNLYLRENAAQDPTASGQCSQAEPSKACTVQVDQAEAGAIGPSGDGEFQWASADGSKVFFTDENKLTQGSTAATDNPDLYEYDLEKPEGKRLTDLTVNTNNASESADVLGMSGASEDGSYLYFVANGVLTGNEKNQYQEEAKPGEPNLYLTHGGATTYIATLLPGLGQGGDACDWYSAKPYDEDANAEDGGGGGYCLTARVSSNGRFLAFNSMKSLTGYNNVGPCIITNTSYEQGACQEIYLYEAASKQLACVSCDPSGESPAGPTSIDPPRESGLWTDTPEPIEHSVSDNGQVFFKTRNALVAADVNDTGDVYEYVAGHLYLLTTGTSPDESHFADASASGNDVFIVTTQALVNSDPGGDYSLYDVRVNGGFRSQNEAVQPPTCESTEGCLPPLNEAPAEFSVASAALSGSGNLAGVPQQLGVKTGIKKPAAKVTRKQRLERALKACAQRYRHTPKTRHRCERQAHRDHEAKTSSARRNHGRAGK